MFGFRLESMPPNAAFTFDAEFMTRGLEESLLADVSYELEHGCRNVFFAMEDVNYINTDGVRLLVSVQQLVGSKGGVFALINPSPAVKKVLSAMNLIDVFTRFGDLEGAVGYFR